MPLLTYWQRPLDFHKLNKETAKRLPSFLRERASNPGKNKINKHGIETASIVQSYK
jgi:hypothetical protein